jgi:hypothetical protein
MTHPDGGTPNIVKCTGNCISASQILPAPETNALLNCMAGGDSGVDRCDLACLDVIP